MESVYFNGACLATTTTSFCSAREPIPLVEFPYPGWVFYGWQINNTFIAGPLGSYNLTGPTTFTPLFSIAKRVHFMTNPLGLQRSGGPLGHRRRRSVSLGQWRDLQSDSSPSIATRRLRRDFPRSALAISIFYRAAATPSARIRPQTDQPGITGCLKDSPTASVRMEPIFADTATNVATTLTASFVPGVKVTLTTSQPGLQLTVDGRTQLARLQLRLGPGRNPYHQRSGHAGRFAGQHLDVRKLVQRRTADADPYHADDHHHLALMATFTAQPQVTINSFAARLAVHGRRIAVHDALRGEPHFGILDAGGCAGGYFFELGFADQLHFLVRRLDVDNTRTVVFNQSAQTFTATYQSQWAVVRPQARPVRRRSPIIPTTTTGFSQTERRSR